MFKAPKEKEKEFHELSKTIVNPKNHLINKNDYLEFQIFTNKGEIIIDPTSEFTKQASSGGTGGGNRLKYLIQADGCADLPIIGHIKLDSLNLHQCDSLLAQLYGKYYLDVFVVSRLSSQKVYVLNTGGGGLTGSSQSRATAITLEHENTTLFEIITSIGGLGQYSHADRIKIIRGNPNNPTIYSVDLTKWDSFQKSQLIVQPNDLIYIEPLRRSAFELLRDVSQITGIFSVILSLYLLSRL